MKKLFFVLLLGTTVALWAESRPTGASQAQPGPSAQDQPATTTYWSAPELKGLAKELSPKAKASDRHIATKGLLRTRTHTASVIHREATDAAEQHEGVSDFWIVESGEGTLAVGGEIVDRRELVAGEYRGPSIRGGEKFKLAPGDHVNIPPNTPHQMLLESGQAITYTIVKVNVGLYPWSLVR